MQSSLPKPAAPAAAAAGEGAEEGLPEPLRPRPRERRRAIALPLAGEARGALAEPERAERLSRGVVVAEAATGPTMVYVLPEPDCPYARHVALQPCATLCTSGLPTTACAPRRCQCEVLEVGSVKRVGVGGCGGAGSALRCLTGTQLHSGSVNGCGV